MRAIFQQARISEKNSAPRKHHIVPNSYLARWAVDDRVRVTDLRASISYEASPAKAARETDFYRLDSPDLDSQELPPLLLETILSHIEGKGKSAIDTLLASSPGQLTLYEAIDLANFMAFSFTRGRHFREEMARVADDAMKLMWSRTSDEGIRKQLIDNGSEGTDEEVAGVRKFLDDWNAGKFFVAPQKASLAGTAADLATEMFFYFLARPWRVYHSLAQIVTCDEPVVLVGGPRHNRRERSGLASAGVVLFPLDPHHLLVMFHPEMDLDEMALHPELLPSETDEVNREVMANAARWVIEKPGHNIAALSALPPLPPASVQEQIRVINDEKGEYYRHFTPTRWWRSLNPPPWPVDRWWSNATGARLDCLPYEWRVMPDALFPVLG